MNIIWDYIERKINIVLKYKSKFFKKYQKKFK